MALGEITVNALNLKQGPFPTVENHFLFIGEGATNQDTILFLNTDSDLDVELGSVDSEIKRQVVAAKLNAGQSWAAVVIPLADGSLWDAAVDLAMNENVRVETIVICTPVTAQADLTAMQAKALDLIATYGRRVSFIATAIAIDATPVTGQSWSAYITAINDLTDTLAADRVTIVPYIYNDWAGIYAGRLCNDQTSVADTPMRVATGTIVGQDQSTLPVDKDGIKYSNAHAKALNDQRFTVPAFYADYEGVYCSDGQVLDVVGGDYTVIENLRVVDKAARMVRIVLIGLLGDRRFNSTPAGEAWAISKLMRPLREMSRSTEFQGIPFPAELQSPKDGDIAIAWITRTQVEIFMIARPFSIPKDITANIVLDLSAPTA
tara:strand:+ start:88555 stop:89685 length:1131 start_codon:yes stop_codon:yes gene_type:complete